MHPVVNLTILPKSNYQVANRTMGNVCVCVFVKGGGGHWVTGKVSAIFRAHAKASVSRWFKVITVHYKQNHLSKGEHEKPLLWGCYGTNMNNFKKSTHLSLHQNVRGWNTQILTFIKSHPTYLIQLTRSREYF